MSMHGAFAKFTSPAPNLNEIWKHIMCKTSENFKSNKQQPRVKEIPIQVIPSQETTESSTRGQGWNDSTSGKEIIRWRFTINEHESTWYSREAIRNIRCQNVSYRIF
jgi:hypothetical protein